MAGEAEGVAVGLQCASRGRRKGSRIYQMAMDGFCDVIW